jgi:hypothetical protein
MFYPVVDKAVATAMLALLYVSAVIFVAAFLFAAVELLDGHTLGLRPGVSAGAGQSAVATPDRA